MRRERKARKAPNYFLTRLRLGSHFSCSCCCCFTAITIALGFVALFLLPPPFYFFYFFYCLFCFLFCFFPRLSSFSSSSPAPSHSDFCQWNWKEKKFRWRRFNEVVWWLMFEPLIVSLMPNVFTFIRPEFVLDDHQELKIRLSCSIFPCADNPWSISTFLLEYCGKTGRVSEYSFRCHENSVAAY